MLLPRTLTTIRAVWLAGLAGIVAPAPAVAQRPLNLNVEQASDADARLPRMWWAGQTGFAAPSAGIYLDSTVAHEGRRSVRLEYSSAGGNNSVWAQSEFTLRAAGGRRVRLSGWVRTRDKREGEAVLRVQYLDSAWTPIRTDTMPGRGVRGTAPWRRLVLDGTAPVGTSAIGVGVQAAGRGVAWFDALDLMIDGVRMTTAPDDGPPPATPAERAWLRNRSTAVTTPVPGGSTADLAPLGTLIGNAPLVSLGEATHGSREIFQLKHRVFAHLVRYHGFSVMMLEANQAAAERVNQFVLTGKGDAREALRGLFQVLQTEEVLALIEWARSYNAAGPARPVEIVGFDMQDPQLAIDSVTAFVHRVDPGFAPVADSAYHDFRNAWRARAYPRAGDSVSAAWQRGAERVQRHLVGQRSAYLATAVTSADSMAVRWAVQHATVVQQASLLRPTDAGRVLRDSLMAANILWTLDARPAGTRAVVWAHNGHVARRESWMGNYLERLRPGAQRVIGITTAGGQYRTARPDSAAAGGRTMISATLNPAPRASVEAVLVRSQTPYQFIDLRGAGATAAGRWLTQERPAPSAGGAVQDWTWTPTPTGRDYDALFFLRTVTAARGLPE